MTDWMTETGPTSQPAWFADAVEWLDGELAARGQRRKGDLSVVRARPWGTVLQAETTLGPVWFKACAPATAFEVPLYVMARRVAPAHVLEPVAVDVDRSWVVLPDGGPLLADEPDRDLVMARLLDVLPRYAELQIAFAGHVEELLTIGLTDMGPSRLPERFEQALEVVSAYLDRRGDEGERATYAGLVDLRPRVVEWSSRLASMPGGLSLDHNDLHAWNVFYAERDGGDGGVGGVGGVDVRFYDWGDAVVAHPFASMMIGLGWLTGMWQVDRADPRLVRARDAYLEPFAVLGPHAELVETMELSCRLGEIARALVWARALGEYGEQAPDSFQTAPLEHLSGLLGPGT
jgi:hypothetical protein